jgi:hypothetical protein
MTSAGLQQNNSQSAIELLMTQPTLLENLRKAHMGNYSVVLSLLGCLDHGFQAKKLVDRIIDTSRFIKSIYPKLCVHFTIFQADQVTNLREDILTYRLKYSLTSMGEATGEDFLSKAVKALEK